MLNDKKILDYYYNNFPSPQNALDIFKEEWSSKLPPPFDTYKAGKTPIFEDARIDWAISKLDIKGKKIIELGPLEGGHSYMLEKSGAESIVSIEANSKAFLKCLIVKELLGLKKTKFLSGNFLEYLKNFSGKFDTCIASGVLYHMKNPVELLYHISKVSDGVFIWTHYYDKNLIQNNPDIKENFGGMEEKDFKGFSHVLYYQNYNPKALEWGGFCGGSSETTCWMKRDEILNCLKWLNYNDIEINFEQPDHPNGPSFAIIARK